MLFIHTNIYLQTWYIAANDVTFSPSTEELQINSINSFFVKKCKQIKQPVPGIGAAIDLIVDIFSRRQG
jgi:hypothetical protein